MNEQIQNILTLLVVGGAAVYAGVAVRGLFLKKDKEGCTSHGCPSCGIKNELKDSYAKKVKAGKVDVKAMWGSTPVAKTR
jgi:hypothetical protein